MGFSLFTCPISKDHYPQSMSRTGFYFSFTPGLLSIGFLLLFWVLVNIRSLGYSVLSADLFHRLFSCQVVHTVDCIDCM
jgi:hypothetical protein